jgi:hypothetical protein
VRSRRGPALLGCDPVSPRERGALGLSWAKSRKERKNPFIFLFQFSKAIFQKILNPLLNLNQTTQYKNSNAAA